MLSELIRASLVGAGFLLIFGVAEAWRIFGQPSAELSRKLVHFMGGLLVLAFPWIFDSRWTVIGLVLVFAFLIWGTEKVGLLKSIHGVARKTEGGLFYPLAVALLFIVAYDNPPFYLASALALIVSDAAAAILGTRYGTKTYSVEEDRRSLEGSISFFVITLLVVHLPLLLMTDTDRGVTVILAVLISLIVTLLEGVSLRGSDNLIVPMATFYLLVRFTPEDFGTITMHLFTLLSILAFVSLFGLASHFLRTSGAMAATLFFYAVYLFGGGGWVTAPAIAFTTLVALQYILRDSGVHHDAQHQVLATLYAVIVILVVLIVHDVLPRVMSEPMWLLSGEVFRGPFLGVVIGQLTMMLVTQFKPFHPGNREPTSIPMTLGLLALALGLVAPLGLVATGGLTLVSFGAAATIAVLATLLYWLMRKLPWWPSRTPWNMRLQTACIILATLLVLPVHFQILRGG
jgi:dolichol kinase